MASLATSRKLLALQLALFAIALATCVADAAMVESRVACATYRQATNVLSVVGMAGLIGAALLLAVRAVAQLLRRQLKPFLITLAICIAEAAAVAAAVWIDVDVGILYCAFDHVDLPACLLGCPH